MEEKNHSNLHNLKIYWSFLSKYKFWLFSLLLLVLIIEASYTAENFLFKYLIDSATSFSNNILAKTIFISILVSIAIYFASLVLLRTIFRWVHIHLTNNLEVKLIQDVKKRFFQHLIFLSHKFHVTHKTGSLISRLIRSGSAIERMTDVIIFNFSPLIFHTIVIFFSIAYFTIVPAILLLGILIFFILFSFIIQKLSYQANLDANSQEDREKAHIADFFTNIDAIKYYGKEKIVQQKFEALTEKTKISFLKNWNYGRWTFAGEAFILGVGVFLLLYLPLKQFLAGQISIGTIVFIYSTYISIMGSLFSFVHGIRAYYRSMADFDELFQYLDIQQDVKDIENAKPLRVSKGEVKFENVNFSYDSRKIISDFNLTIPAGKKVALVGHSGSGKTTLVKLLYRFYDLSSGKILIDNQNIKNVNQESLRESMSIVPQEAVLFDDTIYNNIAFSNPKASKTEVFEAIKFAQLDNIIKEFPNKENTIVGERGVKLSGGEKQRVSIARAILANKKILVLDEATSSLDSQTEHEIQQDLKKLMENRTSIIIAHRLSTIMTADIIVVMKKGKIVQMGSHRNLISKDGEYQTLWNLQKGGYIK